MDDSRVPTAPALTIVIVNWNSAAYVCSCIRTIVGETRTVAYEIIVVDNASFDNCGNELAAQFRDVVFIQSQRNLGFGGANNLGAEHARGGVLLFLNPDTQVQNGALDRLFDQYVRFSSAGVFGCRLLNTDGSLQVSCVQAFPTPLNQAFDLDFLRRWIPRARLWGTEALFADLSEPIEVAAVSGACMMVRKAVFDSVGGFSPAFFMYGEDIDLCARVAKAGYRNAHVGDCKVLHHGGGSSRHVQSTSSVITMCNSIATLLDRLHGPHSGATYRALLLVLAGIRLMVLAVTSPAWWAVRGWRSWIGTCRKWLAIVGWATGINGHIAPLPSSGSVRANR